jgi:hypothetical protein
MVRIICTAWNRLLPGDPPPVRQILLKNPS